MSKDDDKGKNEVTITKYNPEEEGKGIEEIQEEQFELLSLSGQKLDPEKVQANLERMKKSVEVLEASRYKEPVYVAVIGVDQRGQIFIDDSSKDIAKTAYMFSVGLNRLIT